MNPRSVILYLTILLQLAFVGCASGVYHFNKAVRPTNELPRDGALNSIVYGGAHPHLDRIERVIYFPSKTMNQWFGDREAPKLSDEEKLQMGLYQSQKYLELHGLTDLNIDVREYDPAKQWSRLQNNQSISPLWKYTAGTVNHIEYCLVPGRVLYRDSYNAFTKTLSMNSLHPEQALYASATARYLESRKNPGAFASSCYLPFVPLYRDYHVANDVLSYARYRENWEMEKKLYPQIYGSFGGDLVAQATSLVPGFAYLPFYVKPALEMGGQLGGTATGTFVSHQRETEMETERLSRASMQPNSSTNF